MRKDTCKHFNGIQNTTCDAGILYKSVTSNPEELEGSALRLPCHTTCRGATPSQLEHFNRRGTCAKFELPTAFEIEAERQAFQAAIERQRKVYPLIAEIKQTHKGQQWSGTVPCPVCGGNLRLSHAARNGHIWGRCETEGCVAWME